LIRLAGRSSDKTVRETDRVVRDDCTAFQSTRKPGRRFAFPEEFAARASKGPVLPSFLVEYCKPESIGGASDYYRKTRCRRRSENGGMQESGLAVRKPPALEQTKSAVLNSLRRRVQSSWGSPWRNNRHYWIPDLYRISSERLRKVYGHIDLGRVVGTAGLHQCDTDVRILTEARSGHASARTGPHDDVINSCRVFVDHRCLEFMDDRFLTASEIKVSCLR
jgi:hypothetical protein